MDVWKEVVVAAAAFAAGLINSIAGGGTLVSFPALIWTGRDPVLANATSTVALWPASLAGAYGFRREQRGGARLFLLFAAPSFVGGALGAVLLLRTPSVTFARLVPFLILFATLLLAVQEPLSRRLRGTRGARRGASDDEPRGEGVGETSGAGADERSGGAYGETTSRAWWAGAIVFQFFVGVYGGYFGAGIGILMLAALGLLGFADIHRMNALKNLLAICINGVAALYFIGSGAVIWSDVLLMTFAAIAGGYSGARLAYKLGRRFVRLAVIAIGLAMSASLFLKMLNAE
ncbi:MAG: sulfite exporter TauE/SafE family protein [Acidobacteria bacterium]|nr:MAG: sulfite exporter TauE/SafE family protein [Acidobacteriota bacterium]PYS82122.1 MAG: sulfite exporter TauE/SafE family protein [Acidobacteriota bacterium]